MRMPPMEMARRWAQQLHLAHCGAKEVQTFGWAREMPTEKPSFTKPYHR